MEFTHFLPSGILKPYVKHYYVFESGDDTGFEDTVFPSGDMEMIFNLGCGTWESLVAGKFRQTPKIELWGQITRPLAIRSSGRHTMLGIRFFTHSAACFFNDEMGIFNNRITDVTDIIGSTVKTLHARLIETRDNLQRIALVETFLLNKLIANEKKVFKVDKVANILASIKANPAENNLNKIATDHGITTRYLHKLLFQSTGLSPAVFSKINRFQSSLKLLVKNEQPLTEIAYHCGYFDQSHFIRDFKTFTGITPSAYLENSSALNLLMVQ